MLSMTVVMTLVARRKTCFPAAGCVIATKAEPSEDAKAFCVSFLWRNMSYIYNKVESWK